MKQLAFPRAVVTVVVEVAVATILTLHSTASAAQEPPVVNIGSKATTEPVILGEVLTLLAENAGAEAVHRAGLGGTQILFQALVKGDIDAYVDYTGTLALEVLYGENVRSEDDIRAALQKRGIQMLGRLGFNNSYALGMTEDLAGKLNIRTISDLSRRQDEPEIAQLKCGFSDEFLHRNDGWPGLKRAYDLRYEAVGMDHHLAYQGLARGAIQITDLYSTDAEIEQFHLRLLEDDRNFFPQYHCVVLYRAELAERAPQVVRAWRRLEGKITSAVMIDLNAQASQGVPAKRVAANFLQAKMGLEIAVAPSRTWGTVWHDFWRHTWQHLFLVSVSLAAAVAIAVPLGIAAYKLPAIAQPILSSVGIVQTIPSLSILVFMLPLLGVGALPAILALFLYSLLPIVRSTYAGLHEIPGGLKESAIVLGLPTSARLRLIELPIASRSILSGIKTAAVINVGTATLGALIGAGGYGEPILTGLRLYSLPLTLEGAIPAAGLALLVQGLFELSERWLVPAGLRISRGH